MGLMYTLSTVLELPEIIFNIIPMAKLIFAKMLNNILPVFSAPNALYNPRSILSFYTDPLEDYFSSLSLERNSSLVIGHSVGGGIAKLVGISKNITSFAFNSPEIRLWYMNDVKNPDLKTGKIMNLRTTDEMFTGSEEGGTTSYIPLESFPQSPASFPLLQCLAAKQCGDYEYYEDYCNNSTQHSLLQRVLSMSKF